MSILLFGDCLEELKNVEDNSVDLIFCDLPYGQTSCKWDCIIPIDKLWIEFMRVKKLHTPIIMTTTTKFGLSLLNSCPKKCPFRYDLVWCKSAAAGFLCAKKMPMRKHEMIYVFYEKLPLYDLSSHTHKFIKETPMPTKPDIYGRLWDKNGKPYLKNKIQNKYDPPLPNSLIKEDKHTLYGEIKEKGIPHQTTYDPPLPTSLIKEEKTQISKKKDKDLYGECAGGTIGNVHGTNYEPPLPTSLIKGQTEGDIGNECYGKFSYYNNGVMGYEPKLPTSLIKEGNNIDEVIVDVYNAKERFKNGKLKKNPRKLQKGDDPIYEPALPNSLLEIKSTRGKHSTEKPVALMSWILKYYSKEGDVVLDPTMGSGSMGVACKEMNRNFIGIEKDEEIYEVAFTRIDPEN